MDRSRIITIDGELNEYWALTKCITILSECCIENTWRDCQTYRVVLQVATVSKFDSGLWHIFLDLPPCLTLVFLSLSSSLSIVMSWWEIPNSFHSDKQRYSLIPGNWSISGNHQKKNILKHIKTNKFDNTLFKGVYNMVTRHSSLL